MRKCRYCGMELNHSDEYFNREHVKACKYVSPMSRYINSGITQKEYPKSEKINHRTTFGRYTKF
jgi:hypothetical protein